MRACKYIIVYVAPPATLTSMENCIFATRAGFTTQGSRNETHGHLGGDKDHDLAHSTAFHRAKGRTRRKQRLGSGQGSRSLFLFFLAALSFVDTQSKLSPCGTKLSPICLTLRRTLVGDMRICQTPLSIDLIFIRLI